MKDWSVLLIGVGVIGLLAWSGCQESRDQQAWRKDRDRQLTEVQAKQDSADRLLRFADSQKRYADSQSGKATQRFRQAERTVSAALHYRDSMLLTLGTPADTCLPFLLIARLTEDSLVGALRVTQEAFDSLTGSYGLLERAYQAQLTRAGLLQSSTDSLVALVHRAPTPKRFTPILTVGYGAVLNGGVVRTGPMIGVGLKVPF